MQACAGELRIRQPLGIIVSVPGIVDENSGQVLFSPNLHWTEKAPLSDLIGEVWDAPVVFVQELRALALGHRMFDESDEDFNEFEKVLHLDKIAMKKFWCWDINKLIGNKLE